MASRKAATPKPKKEKAPKAPKAPKVKKDKKGDATPKFEKVKSVKVKAPRVRAPKDVYTLVLLLSFLIFLAATIFLYFDLASYK